MLARFLPSPFRTPLVVALVGAAALVTTTDAFAAMKTWGTPKVSFSATGSPGFLDIEGVTNSLTVSEEGGTLSFTVPMKTIHTGIDLRDTHMNEKYVETEKFPDVLLTFAKSGVTWPANAGESTSGKVTASFVAHGAPAPVEVTYKIKRTKAGYSVNAQFPFDVSEHGIAIPSYLGVTVDPKMKAEVNTDLVDAP